MGNSHFAIGAHTVVVLLFIIPLGKNLPLVYPPIRILLLPLGPQFANVLQMSLMQFSLLNLQPPLPFGLEVGQLSIVPCQKPLDLWLEASHRLFLDSFGLFIYPFFLLQFIARLSQRLEPPYLGRMSLLLALEAVLKLPIGVGQLQCKEIAPLG